MTASTTASVQTDENKHAHVDPAAQLHDTSFVPVQTRSERPRSFVPEDFGHPHGREVNWKHTPVDKLTALFAPAEPNNGVALSLSDQKYVAEGLEIGAAPRGEFFVPEDIVGAVAWQGAQQALHVQIPQNETVEQPLLLTVTGQGGRADGHLVIEALPNSSATIILRHTGTAQYAQNVEILVRDGARLKVVTVQEWDDDAQHVSAHQARVDRDAFLEHFVVSFGGGIVRVNTNMELSGSGSHGRLYGLSYGDTGQHLESQVYMYHKGAYTNGDVLYKGALQGKTARSVWIGDVLIGREAVGTDSYEANRNLLLTEGARADSIPNLEIETGDIAGAGHASATGRFDEEQLFYLQARGIPEAEARRLVVLGFLTEVVQKLALPELEAELTAAIEAELAEVDA
ncbi:Fe-S cluster assembly protein SufD [Microbacterium sp. YY-01]|uniref:Fe-S cluster assembly protein SufD n=1 Tax=Microbacterium sp. YY-01 TaxID=3421634 RepID=UPI003D1839E5